MRHPGCAVLATNPASFLILVLLCVGGLASAGQARAAWVDAGWSNRVEISAKSSMIAGSFTDFTLLLHVEGDSLSTVFDVAKADGSDLMLTAADGVTPLGQELVSYDAVARDAQIWFRAPSLTPSTGRFYLYYGNPDTTLSPIASDAWANDHIAVYHFDDDPGLNIVADSSPWGNFATGGAGSTWASSDTISAKAGLGWNFNGDSHWVDGDNVSSTDSTYTISAWFACWNLDQDANFAFSGEQGFWHLSAKRNSGQRNSDFADPGGFFRWNPAINDTLLHHYLWTLDGVNDTLRFYYDGVEQSGFRWTNTPGAKVYTGIQLQGNIGIASPLFGQSNPFDMMEGIVDEYHIIEGARSSEWVSTEFSNQNDAVGFYTYVIEDQPVVVAVDPFAPALGRVSVYPNPFRMAASVDVDMGSGAVAVAVYDVAGRRVRVLQPAVRREGPFRLQWDGRDDHGDRVAGGIYFLRALGGGSAVGAKVLYLR
jgi:Concanavalin A-like lectin/glucanases superfamily/FlgD Ig-like domain/Domain of unknown function (DUF2341)